MSLRKFRDAIVGGRAAAAAPSQPPYHSEVSDEYLAALQRQVNAAKPEDFSLTPLSQSGW